MEALVYQCPFGLRLHFYMTEKNKENSKKLSVSMPFRAGASFLLDFNNETSEFVVTYQCPLGLVLHFYDTPSKT